MRNELDYVEKMKSLFNERPEVAQEKAEEILLAALRDLEYVRLVHAFIDLESYHAFNMDEDWYR